MVALSDYTRRKRELIKSSPIFVGFALSVAMSFSGIAAFADDVAPVDANSPSDFGNAPVLAFPSTFGVPSAVAPKPKSSFIGATLVNPRAGIPGGNFDGDVVAGYSIGNPLDAVSLTFGIALTGTSPLGDAGSFSVSASRLVAAGDTSVTFIGGTVSNLLPWGVNKNRDATYSVYVSHLMAFAGPSTEIPVQISAGYGNETTRSADGSGSLKDGAFVGVGIGLTKLLSASLSATTTQLNAGFALGIPNTGASVSFGVFDVTDNTNRQQFSLSVAYAF